MIILQKILGGAAILNLHEHMLLATRFSFLKEMFKSKQPWIEMVVFFFRKEGLI